MKRDRTKSKDWPQSGHAKNREAREWREETKRASPSSLHTHNTTTNPTPFFTIYRERQPRRDGHNGANPRSKSQTQAPPFSVLPSSTAGARTKARMAALPSSSSSSSSCPPSHGRHSSPHPPPRSKRRQSASNHAFHPSLLLLLLQITCLLLLFFLDLTHASSSRGQNDYYTRLGLKRDANKKEVARAYRRMAVKTHPGT